MKPVRLLKRIASAVLCAATLLIMTLPAQASEHSGYSVKLGVTVYSRASQNAMDIGYMPHGTELEVLGTRGNYYRIDCLGMTGYIRKELVKCQDDVYTVNYRFGNSDAHMFIAQNLDTAVPLRSQIQKEAIKHIGVRYVMGGTSPRGFDCSGFTQYVFRKCGISLERTCEGQIGQGTVISKEELQCGDLVFFDRTDGTRDLVTHVGIYLGDGKLIHASSSKGIRIVELESEYYVNHYLCSRRIIQTEDVQLSRLTDVQDTDTTWMRTRG